MRHIDTQALWVQERVRTKSIILKKVRGELNPADLLIKFIVGKDKVDQLVSLYGLVFRGGRAAAAPLLKKKIVPTNVLEVNVVKDSDLLGDILVPEAEFRDVTRWPHSYSGDDMAKMFPTAIAAPETETIGLEELQEHARLHKRWAATRITVSLG